MTIADFNESDIDKQVTIMGWADDCRDLGALIFITLRDRTGTIQITLNKSTTDPALYSKAAGVRSEYVVAVRGKLMRRAKEFVNPNMITGEYEVIAEELKILGEALPSPIDIIDDTKTNEQARLIAYVFPLAALLIILLSHV